MLASGLERFVIRHLIDDEGLHSLLPALLLRMDSEQHGCASGRHEVTTLYCESTDARLRPRRRVRARLIEGSRKSRTLVEIRHHVGRRSWELRSEATPEQALEACRGNWMNGAPRLLQEAAALVRESGLEPRCLVAAEQRSFVDGASLRNQGSAPQLAAAREPLAGARVPLTGARKALDGDLRVTIDSRLRHRESDLVLRPKDAGPWTELLPQGQHLLEVQVARAVPSWLLNALSRARALETAPGRSHLVRLALEARAFGDSIAEPTPRSAVS